jgi:hypothetical protein
MVHALREAHRVLKPGGLLIDLRPAIAHRRVEILRAGHAFPIAAMRESFDEERAADRAVAKVVRAGLFRPVRRARFECRRVMDGPKDFRLWVEDSLKPSLVRKHRWLIERVERTFAALGGRRRIVARGPLDLRVLAKRHAAPRRRRGRDGVFARRTTC